MPAHCTAHPAPKGISRQTIGFIDNLLRIAIILVITCFAAQKPVCEEIPAGAFWREVVSRFSPRSSTIQDILTERSFVAYRCTGPEVSWFFTVVDGKVS